MPTIPLPPILLNTVHSVKDTTEFLFDKICQTRTSEELSVDPLTQYLNLLRSKFSEVDACCYSVAEDIQLTDTDGNLYSARGLACLCERGRAISITLRSVSPKSFPLHQKSTSSFASNFAPKNERDEGHFSVADHCNALFNELFKMDFDHPQGLVVICGATASAKSQITRGLIHMLLEKKLATKLSRAPHLVTFEDPIEEFLCQSDKHETDGKHPSELAQLMGVDYTPREKGKDVRDLKQAFQDALRQTPYIYFVGETRDPEDWKEVLEFAGTGHLVITTAHAGSLVEMMTKILSAVKASTAENRRMYAGKIKAIVHMKYFGEHSGKKLLLPSLWRNTEKGLASLTATGLSAILPHESVDNHNADSCFGYHAMFQAILAKFPELKNLPLASIARQADL